MLSSTVNLACHVYQVADKPNQKVPKAPLIPKSTFEEPFSRVIVDCVGPLPKTKDGNQYLLTIMCAFTRCQEAILLRNIKAPSIVKALTNQIFHFSRFTKVTTTRSKL